MVFVIIKYNKKPYSKLGFSNFFVYFSWNYDSIKRALTVSNGHLSDFKVEKLQKTKRMVIIWR